MRFSSGWGALLALGAIAAGACSDDAEDVDGSTQGGAGGGGASSTGGGGSGPVVADDPTGWESAGALLVGRALATATVLDDGRVLVVGGEDDAYAMIASVETYDPETGEIADTAPLPEPRSHHTATLLGNGRVLVAGGGQGSEISLPNGEGALASAWLYEPDTSTWIPTGTMSEARAGHRAVLLEDGRVLVVGGGNQVGYSCAQIHPDCTVADSLASAEIYDPETGSWAVTAPLAQPRIGFDLRRFGAGVVASGGAADNEGLESVEIFDVQTGAWASGPALDGQRLYHAAAVLDGKLVVAGGKIANVEPVTSVDVLDEGASQWVAASPLDEPRTGASFVALQSGRGLIVAGNNQLGTRFIAEAAIYDIAADAWSKIEPLATGRYGQAAVLLEDGSVLVVGGRTALGVTTSVERSR